MVTIKHFTASWCQPCKQLSPIMRELISQNPKIVYQKIDVDVSPDVAQQYGVRSVPFVVFEKNGSVIQSILGLQSKSYYQNLINSL
jgi:thioredoxin 1